MVLATILLLAAVIDIRWLKNRHRIVNKVYVSPTYHGMPPRAVDRAGQRHAVGAQRQAARRDGHRARPHRRRRKT